MHVWVMDIRRIYKDHQKEEKIVIQCAKMQSAGDRR